MIGMYRQATHHARTASEILRSLLRGGRARIAHSTLFGADYRGVPGIQAPHGREGGGHLCGNPAAVRARWRVLSVADGNQPGIIPDLRGPVALSAGARHGV